MSECLMQFLRWFVHTNYFYGVILGSIFAVYIFCHPYRPMDRS